MMGPAYTSATNVHYSHPEPVLLEGNAAQSMLTSSLVAETPNADPSPKRTSKCGLYGRAATFILLKTSFLVFAYYCLFHPIPLQSHPDDTLGILPSMNITLTEFKAGITAASVIGHSLAALVVKEIIAAVCSAEFMAQYHRTRGLGHRTSDRVSTLTSGLVDNIVHFVSPSETRTFRLAFVVIAILVAVGPLGSGTMTVGSIIATTNEQISVTNLTSNTMYTDSALQQIPVVMRLEREQNMTFKYDMHSSLSSDPVLIPWPTINVSLPEQSTLVYHTDILHFRFQCAWRAPSTLEGIFPSRTGPVQFSIDHMLYSAGGESPLSDSGIYPLFPANNSFNNVTIIFLSQTFDYEPKIASGPSTLNFSGLPHVLPVKDVNGNMWIDKAAVLCCYPNSRIMPAVVTLAHNTLTAKKLPESTNGTALIGNILQSGADLMINLLTWAITGYDETAYQIFLNSRPSPDGTAGFAPLSPDGMAANVNLYMQSAGKVYLGGSIKSHIESLSSYLLATGQVTFPVAALVSSEQFLVAFTVVVGLIVTILAVLLWTIRRTELILFNLENLTEHYWTQNAAVHVEERAVTTSTN